MKFQIHTAILLGLFSVASNSTTIVQPSLGNNILHSDLIITAQITSGKCLLPGCNESKPHVRYKEYAFSCIKPIFGKCPSFLQFQSAYELKVGATYILMRPADNGGRAIFTPIELRNNNTQVVYPGYARTLQNITLYKSMSHYAPITEYHYYRYNDFVSAIQAIKNDPRFKN